MTFGRPVAQTRVRGLHNISSRQILASLIRRKLIIRLKHGSDPNQPVLCNASTCFLRYVNVSSLTSLTNRVPTSVARSTASKEAIARDSRWLQYHFATHFKGSSVEETHPHRQHRHPQAKSRDQSQWKPRYHQQRSPKDTTRTLLPIRWTRKHRRSFRQQPKTNSNRKLFRREGKPRLYHQPPKPRRKEPTSRSR